MPSEKKTIAPWILKIISALNWPHIKLRISFEYKRIRRQGLLNIIHKAVSKSASMVLWFILLPVTIILHMLGFRRVTVFTERIGHLALEPDCLLKEQAMGHIPKRKWIILAPPNRVANEHLLSYWEPYFILVRQPSLCYLIDSMSRWLLMKFDISHYILAVGKAQAAYRIYTEWGDRPPILKLSEEDEQWAEEKLKELGLPDNAWFVCVHVREGGFSPVDEELHSHRNGSIENTIPAMQEIVRRGGWVIRIGDPTMTPLVPMPQVIDYAHHPMKSARMDIILCTKAKFLLGNTSGIALVSTIFGVPCAIANIIPISVLWFGKEDICISKLLYLQDQKRQMKFSEILKSPISEFQYASQYKDRNILAEENTSSDIKDLVVEMLDKLSVEFEISEDDIRLQNNFISLFEERHYAFYSKYRVGTSFLRKYRDLL